MYLFEIRAFFLKYFKELVDKNIFITSADLLPTQINLPFASVINLSNSDEVGTHWVTLVIDEEGAGFYFDTYGRRVSNKHINLFIKLHCKKIYYNDNQIQSIDSKVCGQYCCIFIYLFLKNNFSLKKFSSMFKNNYFINDLIIERKFNNLK